MDFLYWFARGLSVGMPIATDLPDRQAKNSSSHLRYCQNIDNLIKNIKTFVLEFA